MKMASSSASLGPDLHNHDHQMLKMIRKPMKPLMLKDFLLDDLSSCSSNGFKSFPRRQCCTTVRFLLEIDLKQRSSSSDHRNKKSHHDQRLQRSRSRSSSSSSTMSALQRASDAVINAVKHFPFPSVKKRSSSPSPSLLPRSLSRKLFFWGKSDKIRGNGIGRSRLTLPDQALEEHYEPSNQNTTTTTTTSPTVVITTTTGRVSTSTSSNSKSNSWCESEFASDILSSTENDVAEGEKDVSQTVNNKVDITVGEDSTEATHTPKEWPNEEEKQQFSPVSVLDCPFEDDDHDHHDHDETSSPFHHKLARLEGNKQKLLQKIRRFENLAQLEPVDLEKRIAKSELEDKLVKISIHEDSDHDKRKESERKAREMMKLIKINSSRTTGTSTPLKINNLVSKVDNLLFDFFRERVMEESKAKVVFNQKEALREAEDWVNGETRQVFLGWEVEEARNAYVKDMEKGGKWTKLDEEKQEICFELEFQLLDSLVLELSLDLL